MNDYLKNSILTVAGGILSLCGWLIPHEGNREVQLWLDIVLLTGLVLIARGLGRLLVLTGISLRRKKDKTVTVNIERDHQVRGKSIQIAWCATLFLFAILWLHPEFVGSPNNLTIIPLVVFFWHIVYLPVWLYVDKNHVMQLKRPGQR